MTNCSVQEKASRVTPSRISRGKELNYGTVTVTLHIKAFLVLKLHFILSQLSCIINTALVFVTSQSQVERRHYEVLFSTLFDLVSLFFNENQ